jgi:ribonuclease VapC
MFIDTSAVVAILMGEPEADGLLDVLAQDAEKITAPHVRLESTIILARHLGLEVISAQQLFDEFLIEAGISVVPVTDAIGRRAVLAFAQFGKGRGHPAQLNFGDCLSYGCAAEHRSAILFKGEGFTQTDLKPASL